MKSICKYFDIKCKENRISLIPKQLKQAARKSIAEEIQIKHLIA